MLRVQREPRLDSRHEAFSYQLQAVSAVRNLEYAALFHEQGLGKTKIGLDLALTWIRDGVVDSVVIVTKRGLVRNWSDEVKTHTYFDARILDQDRRANFFAFNSPARLYLTHYEVLKAEERRFALFLKTRRVGVILDESHKIKNPDAELTKSLLALAPGFVRRVIMTGTPVANRPYDLWSQIRFLDDGRSLGSTFAEFRDQLNLSNDLADDVSAQTDLEGNLAGVFTKIRPFTVRETKRSAGLELPDKRVENLPIALAPRQRQLYDRIRSELRADVVRDGALVEDNSEDILKRLLRLVQVASNPRLVDERLDEEPGKLAATRQLIDRALAEGSKAIIWSSFVENATWLAGQFESVGSVVVHGRLSATERETALERFKHDAVCRVLTATPASAKEGLTLTVATHAIFFDRSFSLDDYLQAQDRIHRISQTKPCYVWNLVATGTVDEWVDMLLSAKHLAAQLAQGDIDQAQYAARASYDFGRVVREILGSGDEHEPHNQ